MAAAFPIVLVLLALVTLLVPSPAEPDTPPPPALEQKPVEHTVSAPPAGSFDLPGVAEPSTAPGAPATSEAPVAADEPAPPDALPPNVSPTDDEPVTTDAPVTPEAPPVYFMPVDGVRVSDVPPTFGDPRGSDRSHQGIDIVAARGTPVRSAAAGVVWRTSDSVRGGISVTVIGDDGVRYFYTHLDSIAEGVDRDVRVGTDTVLGYVGNTGNAAATAPHLHFEVALPIEGERYRWQPIDPLLYLLDR